MDDRSLSVSLNLVFTGEFVAIQIIYDRYRSGTDALLMGYEQATMLAIE